MQRTNKLIFIIAHKYFRQYRSYISLYIENINKYYPESLIIIVDNNSKYIDDIKTIFNKPNIIVLINNTISKFEIGAYQVGLKYIIDNNICDYTYIIFAQDTMLLNKPFDINFLVNEHVYAATLWSHKQAMNRELPIFLSQTGFGYRIKEILTELNICDKLEECIFCWCHCFIIHLSKIDTFYNMIKNIIHPTRCDSYASERYMTRILYELNNHKSYSICGDTSNYSENLYYYLGPNKNLETMKSDCYFIKHAQTKDENTPDI
jgi:hypothetical protein